MTLGRNQFIAAALLAGLPLIPQALLVGVLLIACAALFFSAPMASPAMHGGIAPRLSVESSHSVTVVLPQRRTFTLDHGEVEFWVVEGKLVSRYRRFPAETTREV
jgi:uncharacterized protein (DUF58 family)